MSVDIRCKTFTKKPGAGESGTQIPCPLCGSENFKPFLDCGEWEFVKCRWCGVALQNPQPDEKSLLARYDDEYFLYEEKNEPAFLRLALLGLKDIGFDKLSESLPDRSILDIGCATGILLKHFREKGWTTAGVEVCEASARFGNERYKVNIHNGLLGNAPFLPQGFSVVYSSHVIEHVNQPLEFIGQAVRLLKPGGLFICTTPDRSGFQARLFGKNWRSAIADHLFLFRSSDLLSLFGKSGLKTLVRKTWGGLGEGYAPKPVKRFMDRWVKITGTGDVVMMAAKKLPY
jgi:2-polyprenyl-3-methyl-5-hydroxy-6-metoxy-1,4-benzoquinol methylase